MTELPENLFPSVIGQENAKRIIFSTIKSNRLAHAYLFTGPEGVGKLPLALEVARFLNCLNTDGKSAFERCECRSCYQMRLLEKVRHPNLMWLFPLPSSESDKGEAAEKAKLEILNMLEGEPYAPIKFLGSGQIHIGLVHFIVNTLSLAPSVPGVRVVIIFPADHLNEPSANALLKLLEEPPDRILLILISESVRDLLPTIVSRCQQIRFRRLTQAEIETGLLQRGFPRERAARLVSLAEGSLTRALQFAAEENVELADSSLDFLRAAAVGNVSKLNEWIDAWTGDKTARSDLAQRLEFARFWVSDAMAIKAFGSETSGRLHFPDGQTSSGKMAERYPISRLEQAFFELEEAKLALESNAVPNMALSALSIKLRRVLS